MANHRPKSLSELNNVYDKAMRAERAIKEGSNMLSTSETETAPENENIFIQLEAKAAEAQKREVFDPDITNIANDFLKRYTQPEKPKTAPKEIKRPAPSIQSVYHSPAKDIPSEKHDVPLSMETGFTPEEIVFAEMATGPAESLQRETGEDGFTLFLAGITLRRQLSAFFKRPRYASLMLGILFPLAIFQEVLSIFAMRPSGNLNVRSIKPLLNCLKHHSISERHVKMRVKCSSFISNFITHTPVDAPLERSQRCFERLMVKTKFFGIVNGQLIFSICFFSCHRQKYSFLNVCQITSFQICTQNTVLHRGNTRPCAAFADTRRQQQR